MNVLNTLPCFEKIKQENNIIKAYLNQEFSSKELNQLLFEKGIVLSHLVKRKERLENQFFQLIKENK